MMRHTSLKAVLMAAIASGAMLPAAAHASAAEQAADSSQIQDIVVTARRATENAQRTPVSITAVTSVDIERRALTTAAELTKSTPSLNIVPSATSPGGLQVSLRAQVMSDTAAFSTGSTGVYLNDTYQGAANIAGSLLDFSDLQRVEVLKGPQGTLYGRNVTGGVVKFVTNKPTDQFEGYVKGGLGNYNRHYLNGMVNLPLAGDKLAFRGVASFDEHGGYSYDVRSKRDLDDMHRWMARGELLAKPTDNLEISLMGYAGEEHDNGVDNRAFYLQPGINTGSMNVMVHEHINGITAGALAPIIFNGSKVPGCTSPTGTYTDPSCGLSLAAYNATLGAFGTAGAAVPAAQALVAAQFNAPRNQAEQDPNYPQYTRTQLRGATGTISLDLGDVTLRSISAFVYGKTDRGFNVGGSSFIPIFTQQFGVNKQYSQEFQVNGVGMDNKLKYAVGFYYLRSNITDNRDQSSRDGAFIYFLGQRGLGVTSGSQSLNNVLVTSTATYGQFTYAITDAVHFTGGLRYTDESNRVKTFSLQLPNLGNGNQTVCISPAPNTTATPVAQCSTVQSSSNFHNWSYTAGLDWSITPDIMVYGKTSRGFKAGGTNPFGAAGAPILSFAPETDTDYEVGLKADLFDRHARFNIAYYHTDYSNIQRTVAFAFGQGLIATAVQNAAKAKIDGVEAELQVNPLPGLTLGGTFGYTNPRYQNYIVKYSDGVTPKDQSAFPFQSVAKYTYTLTAGYDVPFGENNVHAQVDWSHRSSANLFENDLMPSKPGGTDFVPAGVLTQPAYGLLDLSLSVDVPSLRSTVTVWGKNVLNKRYLVSMVSLVNNGVGTAWGNFGPPATVGVDWKVKF